MTKLDVAKLLKVCERTVEKRIEERAMPKPKYIARGSTPYWHPDVIYAWLRELLLAPSNEVVEIPEKSAGIVGRVTGSAAATKASKLDPAKALERMMVRDAEKLAKFCDSHPRAS